MRRRGGGSIINIGSVSLAPGPHASLRHQQERALRADDDLARILAPDRIRVNCDRRLGADRKEFAVQAGEGTESEELLKRGDPSDGRVLHRRGCRSSLHLPGRNRRRTSPAQPEHRRRTGSTLRGRAYGQQTRCLALAGIHSSSRPTGSAFAVPGDGNGSSITGSPLLSVTTGDRRHVDGEGATLSSSGSTTTAGDTLS